MNFKMRRARPVFLAVLCFAAAAGLPRSYGITLYPDARLELESGSDWIWRGLVLGQGMYAAGRAGLEWGMFSVEAGGLRGRDSGDIRGRLDISAGFNFKNNRNSFAAGWTGYYYDRTGEGGFRDTGEMFVKYSMLSDISAWPRPEVYLCYDYGEADGWYLEAGLTKTYELLNDRMDLDLKVLLGWADGDYCFNYYRADTDNSMLTHVTAMLSMPVMVGTGFEIAPSIGYSALAGREIRRAADANLVDKDSVTCALRCRFYF